MKYHKPQGHNKHVPDVMKALYNCRVGWKNGGARVRLHSLSRKYKVFEIQVMILAVLRWHGVNVPPQFPLNTVLPAVLLPAVI